MKPSPPPPREYGELSIDAARDTRFTRLTLGVVVVLGALLRVAYLDQPMRADEAYTYTEYASRSAYDAISIYTFPNNHLFHTLLVHLAVKLFGPIPWAIRLPAMIAGIALIPATFAMVRRLADARSALVSAAAVAASDPLISYSANARGYSLVCLITVLLVLVADRIATENQLADWLAFVFLTAFGFFTIPIMVFPASGVVGWMLLRRLLGTTRGPRLDRLCVALMGSFFLILILYLPTFMRSGIDSVLANPYVKPRSYVDIRRELPGLLVQVWQQWNLDIPRPIAYGFVILWTALFVMSPGRAGVRAMSELFLTLFAATLAIVGYQRVIPFDRVWLFLAPIYLGMIAAALSAFVGRLGNGSWDFALPLVVAVGLGFCVWTSPAIPEETSKLTVNHPVELVRRLAKELRRGDAVIAEVPADAALRYYMMVNGLPTDLLYDYRINRAQRLFVVVNRPNGQTTRSVLEANRVLYAPDLVCVLLKDFGRSALYVIEPPGRR